MSHPRSTLALGLSSALMYAALTACTLGAAEEPSAGPSTTAVRPDGSPAEAGTWPLTGLPVRNGRDSALPHPVLVVKIDNTEASAPQRGLDAADLVVEELVEGGMTRLAAFYHSRIPDEVGPVRSMRASDIGIVTPVDADMVTSGAARVTIDRITAAGVDYLTEGSTGFYRDSGRGAPYNLFATLSEVAEAQRADRQRPDDYLPWGPKAAALPAGKPANALRVGFSGSRTSQWSFRDGHYVQNNSFTVQGEEFQADSVLVLRVPVGDAGYRDPAGNPVPETDFSGTGKATLFHGGNAVEGQWRKDQPDSTVWLGAAAGELSVPAGRVWIELIPTQGGSLTYN